VTWAQEGLTGVAVHLRGVKPVCYCVLKAVVREDVNSGGFFTSKKTLEILCCREGGPELLQPNGSGLGGHVFYYFVDSNIW